MIATDQETSTRRQQRVHLPDRCPNCGRFVEDEADGFYDREDWDDDASLVSVFCDEPCADRFHEKRSEGVR